MVTSNTDKGRPTDSAWPPQRPELQKIERFFHDTVDLASGRIDTTPVPRPLTAAERVERLARFGFKAESLTCTAPTYRLTPRAPYQSAPEAYLDAFSPTNSEVSYSSGGEPPTGRIWWRLPAQFQTTFMSGVNFLFIDVPPGPVVWSLTFQAFPYQGRTGVVVIEIIPGVAGFTEIEISTTGERTVDIGFVHNGTSLDTRVFWRPGLIDFVFNSVSVQAA